MNKSYFRFFQCMIALGLTTYLVEKLISGHLSFYINLRFATFTVIGIVGLALMVTIGLLLLFSGEQPSLNPAGESKSKKRKFKWIFIFLVPIIAAILGLSILLIWITYSLVFVIGLILLNQFHKTDQERHPQISEISWMALIILAIPLILGIFVPVRPLSASSLSTRGMELSAPASIGQQSIKTMDVAADDRTVLDWIKIFNYEKDLSPYLGKSANVVGFVFHDPRLKTGQFMVGRFAITCCVADAFAIGMAVDWPNSANLADNSWVNVKGPVDELTIDDQKVPFIHAQSVNPVKAPEQPYLYP